MKRPTIAVDLDDVLAANAEGFVKFSNERWGTNLQPEEFQEDLATLWGVNHELVNQRIIEYCEAEIVREYGYFSDAAPVLKRLKQDYSLLLVTSRRRLLMQATKDWVDQYLPSMFAAIHHAGIFDEGSSVGAHKHTKAEILAEIGADYLIDDQLKHCAAASQAGIPSLLFGEYEWNKGKVPKGVTRVRNWQEVEEYFYAKS